MFFAEGINSREPDSPLETQVDGLFLIGEVIEIRFSPLSLRGLKAIRR